MLPNVRNGFLTADAACRSRGKPPREHSAWYLHAFGEPHANSVSADIRSTRIGSLDRFQLLSICNIALGIEKPRGKLSVVARSAHGNADGAASNSDFQRLFARKVILHVLGGAIFPSGDVREADAVGRFGHYSNFAATFAYELGPQ